MEKVSPIVIRDNSQINHLPKDLKAKFDEIKIQKNLIKAGFIFFIKDFGYYCLFLFNLIFV